MCTSPKKAIIDYAKTTKNGKHPLRFLKESSAEILKADGVEVFDIPCRKCQECSLAYAREWALRCVLEANEYEHNYFITVTYDNDHLPERIPICNHDTGEFIMNAAPLVPDHFSAFVKKLRTYYKRRYNHDGIRFFGSGEYGGNTNRPHYHFIFFNMPIYDLKFFKRKNGYNYYTSDSISKIWDKGYVTITEVTSRSAAYVARYEMKKLSKPPIYELPREFIRMSRRPGIGLKYFEDFYYNIYKTDEIYIEGQKYRPPKYFDRKLEEKVDSNVIDDVKLYRRRYMHEVLEPHLPSIHQKKLLEVSKPHVKKLLTFDNISLDKSNLTLIMKNVDGNIDISQYID